MDTCSLIASALPAKELEELRQALQAECPAGQAYPPQFSPATARRLAALRARLARSGKKEGTAVMKEQMVADEREPAQALYKDHMALQQELVVPLLVTMLAFWAAIILFILRIDVLALILAVGFAACGIFTLRQFHKLNAVEEHYLAFCLLAGQQETQS